MPSISVSLDAEVIAFFDNLVREGKWRTSRSSEINQVLRDYIKKEEVENGEGKR